MFTQQLMQFRHCTIFIYFQHVKMIKHSLRQFLTNQSYKMAVIYILTSWLYAPLILFNCIVTLTQIVYLVSGNVTNHDNEHQQRIVYCQICTSVCQQQLIGKLVTWNSLQCSLDFKQLNLSIHAYFSLLCTHILEFLPLQNICKGQHIQVPWVILVSICH